MQIGRFAERKQLINDYCIMTTRDESTVGSNFLHLEIESYRRIIIYYYL